MMEPARVKAAPEKTLMIYDGDCNFCKFWILRWQRATKNRVDYIPSQDPRVAGQFPELPRKRFEEAVQFIESDGLVYSGAEAVFRSLTRTRAWGWLLWLYQHLPGFKPATERAYHFVAQHREGFSILTNWAYGREGALPTHKLVRSLFIRWLGAIYLIAIFSLTVQMQGLIGSNGIAPAQRFMDSARHACEQNHIGWARYHLLPTLCWINASDKFLLGLGAVGCFFSVLVILEIAPAICLFLLWLIYLSLSSVGNFFLMFQWDALLLETGFLAIFFAAPQIWPLRNSSPGPSRTTLWLLRWLLFRLMFESGLVKILGGDVTWRSLNALNFHYETQPLPTWIGWYAHQLPPGFQKFCVFMVFVIELGIPFLIFAPRRLRFVGFWFLVFLQVCILLTGNYCFFNFLTIALCIVLLDDAALVQFIPSRWRGRFLPKEMEPNLATQAPAQQENMALGEIQVPPAAQAVPKTRRNWPAWILAPVAIVILLVSFVQLLEVSGSARFVPEPVLALQQWIAPFASINRYGLFQVMTTSRLEIVVEGSNDGKTWLSYEFKYKPGDPKRRPGFVAPHQPRLDWQMWFAALGTYEQNPWFVNFCVRLLQGSPQVLALLERNPFPNAPPRYIRAQVYDYHFSNFQQRQREGVWWVRQFKGEYLPAFSLADVQGR